MRCAAASVRSALLGGLHTLAFSAVRSFDRSSFAVFEGEDSLRIFGEKAPLSVRRSGSPAGDHGTRTASDAEVDAHPANGDTLRFSEVDAIPLGARVCVGVSVGVSDGASVSNGEVRWRGYGEGRGSGGGGGERGAGVPGTLCAVTSLTSRLRCANASSSRSSSRFSSRSRSRFAASPTRLSDDAPAYEIETLSWRFTRTHE